MEYGENTPQTERQKASISREFLPNGGLAPSFSALLGGIPRRKWAKQEVTLGGGMRRNTSFSMGGMWRKASHAKTWLMSTFSVFHFFSEMSAPPSGLRKQAVSPTLLHFSTRVTFGRMPAPLFRWPPPRDASSPDPTWKPGQEPERPMPSRGNPNRRATQSGTVAQRMVVKCAFMYL